MNSCEGWETFHFKFMIKCGYYSSLVMRQGLFLSSITVNLVSREVFYSYYCQIFSWGMRAFRFIVSENQRWEMTLI